jgi:RNA polymerase sigma-70 factor (ECF subfamily)
MTDDALMKRVREGDDDAFGEIVDRYKDSLVNYLTHLVRSRDRAEEIAQDAFVRLYRNAANYVDQESRRAAPPEAADSDAAVRAPRGGATNAAARGRLGPYLFRIATNLTVTEIRRARRWGLLLPRLQASTSTVTPSPDANLITGEIQRHVNAALERLPLKFRAPLVLFEIEEWSYEAIAAALDVRIGTVKSRISRARDLLRRQLAPWWKGGHNHERHTAQHFDAQPAAQERVAHLHL